jgi:hypothetical protein
VTSAEFDVDLAPRKTPGAVVSQVELGNWLLEIPAGQDGDYRWAQIDDYMQRRRRDFYWTPPVQLSLTARVSSRDLLGTWGFGFWNDPFSLSLGMGGATRRFPVLPNAAWFFYASPPNHLSLRDDIPAHGLLAATFSSPVIPPYMMAPGLPILPLLAFPPAARRLRPLARSLVKDDAVRLNHDMTVWHNYSLELDSDKVTFFLDGDECFQTSVMPRGRLGLVLWIDNQYAAYTPGGALQFGKLTTPLPATLEIRDICVSRPGGTRNNLPMDDRCIE